MLTEILTYKDVEGHEWTDELNFHLDMMDFTDHIELMDSLEGLKDLIGPKRMLKPSETQQLMDMIKFYIKLSYGKKVVVEGRTRFQKVKDHPEVWTEFVDTGAHNAFLKSMFDDPNKAVMFVVNVLPKDVVEQMEAENPEVKEMREQAEKASEPERLPRGTRIVDDVPVAPVLRSVSKSDTDYDAMLAAAEAEKNETTSGTVEPKRPISQQQHDLMKAQLKPDQFEDFMKTRYVPESK